MGKKVKVTKKSRESGKEEKPPEGVISIDALSLEERVQMEKKSWKPGLPRPVAREAVRLWMSIPNTFKGVGSDLLQKMGITDPDILWIMEARSQVELADKLEMNLPTMNAWIQLMTGDADSLKEVKRFFQKLTKNVLGALYRKAITEGDAQRAKLFLQVVDDWKEQFGMHHTGDVVYRLEPEEKAELDRLIEKNTYAEKKE